MRRRHDAAPGLVTIAALFATALAALPAFGQQPLAPTGASGRTVTPVFEGWYPNRDGSFSISFGYFNRNATEALDIALGSDNKLEPADIPQNQPTHFEPRRHWGVFAVRVPADFGAKKVTWTLKIRGETFAIPGSLSRDWQIDALEGEAGTGNTPPSLRFSADGAEGAGPGGITGGPVMAKVGAPVALDVWAKDDGNAFATIATPGREVPVSLTWFKHQGPGAVTFAPPSARLTPTGGKGTTNATFSAPGDYIVRVRANDASGLAPAGHAQCCWSNGFLKVTVTP
jgi:hypothetical protein